MGQCRGEKARQYSNWELCHLTSAYEKGDKQSSFILTNHPWVISVLFLHWETPCDVCDFFSIESDTTVTLVERACVSNDLSTHQLEN